MGPALMAGMQVVSAGASALASRAQGMNEAARLEGEARLAGTQALQRDTQSRDELSRTLSSIRAARAANGLSAFSPNAIVLMQETSRVSAQDRQTMRADYSQKQANLRAGAASARRGARMSLITGLARAAVPLARGFNYSG